MKQLASVLLLLAVAACTSEPPPIIGLLPLPRGPAKGIDMATDARDVSGEIRSTKLDFVARYYRDPASRWPTLSAEEAKMLSAAGMNIVTVWEWHSHDPAYFSHAAGYSDGLSAARQAKAIGQPPGSAIYFAVDYNAPGDDISGPIDRYFRGVAAGMMAAGSPREYKIGVYGSGAVCAYLRRARLAEYAWLSNSTAWHGYNNFSNWNIRQGKRSPSLSFDHDMNEARDEYGGFRVRSRTAS